MKYLPLFLLLTLIAEILGTVGGFGSSVFFVPMAGFFVDFHSVLGITAIFHLSSNLTKVGVFRKGIDWKIVIWLGIPAVAFAVLGSYLGKFVQTYILEFFLGIFLISISWFFLRFTQYQINANRVNAFVGGAGSGIAAGMLGTGGAIRGLALASFGLAKESFVATSAIIDLAIDSGRTIAYYYNGYIHKDDLYLVPFLLLIGITGTLIGKKILNRVSQNQFRKITLYLILIIGLISLIHTIQKVSS